MRHRFERWLFTDRPWWQNHLFAVVVTLLLAAAMSRLGSSPGFPLSLSLLCAVALSAFFGGIWPSLLSTVICLLVANPLLMKLQLSAAVIGSPLPAVRWIISFLVFSALISLLLEAFHRSGRRSAASQRLYTSTLANISDAIVTTNPQGRIEYINRAAVELLKYSLEDVIGQPFETVVDIREVSNGDKAASLTERVRAAGTTVHGGARQVLYCPDGRQIPIEATAAPVCDSSGAVISVVLTIHDCSEQWQTERALQERLALQARFEHIAAVVPGAVHELRMFPDGRQQLTYASHSFKEIFGLDPETLRDDARSLQAMIHPDDLQKVLQTTSLAARKLLPVDLEHRLLTPHRGMRWVALSAVPSREEDGATLWHGVFTDVTERKRAEERLRASQLQLHAALEAGDMGVLMIDLASGVVEMDATARQLWNLEAVTDPVLTVQHLLSVIHPDNVDAARHDYRQMASGAQMHSGEYHLALDNGRDRWLLCRGRIYADESTGNLVKVGVIIDTTHHRQKEERRLHSQKLEALGVLAGGIAHDFNNLLLAIAGNTKLLFEDLPAEDPMRVSVQEIDKATLRAAELVRRIQSFSSLPESGQRQHTTDLRPVLDAVLSMVRATLPARVSIQTDIPDELPAVMADSGQVHQSVINLLTNAVDAAAAANGVVRLQAGVTTVGRPGTDNALPLQPGNYVCIAVSDQGSGIHRDLQQRIFDPFFTTKPTGKGTGLGLATVHGIMKSIDGVVTVDSVPGQGATFSLYFPVQSRMPVAKESPSDVPPRVHKAHVLYVDDEESLVFLMTRTLQRMGHRVTGCASPEQALETFKVNAQDFDLVVSDMAMPGMSGLELAERMLAIRSQLPFVITSGYVDAAAVARAQSVGVRQLIMKPNTVDELSELLHAILQKERETNV